MVKRPTIADLAKAAGVSVATVDRVLNGRLPVSADTAARVTQAAETIGFHAVGLLKQRLVAVPRRTFGFLLQKRSEPFYQALAAGLTEAVHAADFIRGRALVEFVDELNPVAIADKNKYSQLVDVSFHTCPPTPCTATTQQSSGTSMITRIVVARFELIPSSPTFANTAVKPANTADSTAQK